MSSTAVATVLAAAAPPAGGAATDQVILATAGGVLFTVGLFAVCFGHRTGKLGLLAWGARLSERIGGLPGWAGVPGAIALVTLLPTLFGLQWDESLHIAQGRDEGPLANPSHYILLFGIFGGFTAGVVACFLADDRVPRSGLPLLPGWRVPLGGALAATGSAFAMIGFPLDDVWHRLFGQDVTLWSPTHVTMIAGMSLAVLGVTVLMVEGTRAAGRSALGAGQGTLPRLLGRFQWVMLPTSLLLVLSLLQGEFDFGVSQYRLLFHPMIVLAAAGAGLVAARILLGRGAALAAVLGFLVIRGTITLIVGPVFGEPVHVFPLYLAEALVVELVALRVSTRRPLAFGLAAGAGIGTAGLAAEWAWSGVFANPWPASLFPEVAFYGPAMAIAGAVIGAWLGSHLRVADPIRTPALRSSALAAGLAVTAMIFYGLQQPEPRELTGTVELTEVTPAPERTVDATLRLDPRDGAEGADWVREIAWQGGGLISAELERVSEGVYRTTEPIPVHGTWKSALRIAHGAELLAIPVFLPADEAIPAAEVPAPATFTREFGDEKQMLQREATGDGALVQIATVIVALICFALLALWAAALHRLALAAPARAGGGPGGNGRAPAPATPGPGDGRARIAAAGRERITA